MKKTELSKVYCKPEDGEWTSEMVKLQTPMNGTDICGIGVFNRRNRKEIPVSKFLDLLEDRIVPWRLEEIGAIDDGDYLCLPWNNDECISKVIFRICAGFEGDELDELFIETKLEGIILIDTKTFTELETLIGFLK